MPRQCQFSGKKTITGNNVSHSHRKTRRKWKANIQKKRIFDETTGQWVRVKVAARTLRTINKKGLAAVIKEAKKKK